MPDTDQVVERGTCRVVCDRQLPWQVKVVPGTIRLADGRSFTIAEETSLPVRPGGSRAYRNQRYAMTGESGQSPCFWNGEDIRGSGGMPYQRMVPDTFRVYDESRSVLYRPEEDYSFDYYWGTIKRHPRGRIADGQMLLLDYDVWLCRYDSIVLREDGRIVVVEGLTEAPESRELLLPDPPAVQGGVVLANVFTGWGEQSLYDGGAGIAPKELSEGQDAAPLPALSGRYLDATPRTYEVEVIAYSPDDRSVMLLMASSGTDYGRERSLDEESLRWTTPITASLDKPVPLVTLSAYGHTVDWGLSLDFRTVPPESLKEGASYRISADPHSVMNFPHPKEEALAAIPVLNREALEPFRRKLLEGNPVRIAFYGESTTRSGRWPYQLIRALRHGCPASMIYSSNVAIGGENSARGLLRYEHEVKSVNPDLVILEYMLNDSGLGAGAEPAIRSILERLRQDGIPCLIVTNNGMNPLFCGSMRQVEDAHELYRRLAAEFECAFVGGFAYFQRLHEFGVYYVTELKGNMVNHPYGNVDPDWGRFDQVLGEAVVKAVAP
ncbi:SGNH/GDSL hydrolase family protein [Paenibacillus sacheonensis]|uniref:SGNH hydrolase-type esterase domain-containing protein n=1 Tax=Paenibacillus sacheonensis TaxID=742054 RepID=A0A7X4YSA2_9BACL|nr:SGNH/GDSL hydrolase family protein [Paenibacillus sacheonensis]MBM7566971.1 hypothetical protein [Paenibacillus sacheonensis]NBC71593.1 hypothetical protein [Paenibacillus sacheonensis]